MDLEQEREGNKGRQVWLDSGPHPLADYEAMLSGAILTIARFLNALETATSDGISIGRMSEQIRVAEMGYRKGKPNEDK